ncbi:hypothetical protein LTR10_020391 [Elasticomyces elasticus]|uniref:COP9 signalosome complex subunit 6 n=1 Tax=Exophiala sideris TaxID=1016849 RepID=A0ABR0JLA6_9EURO|nr:hypothetical protein LTR10_020391 [Elasticomyces elasticus]KAK5036391.1 hypothetical protein LTS07_002118 [Exophiala sideris]KAK5041777.1 hypothetical protein LTR13_002444 [Exophiala sideris]KAK5066775.1 hypothetical protein LTR69_002122 [Exophiala sideris]KAK5184833.1 hypothetical protein LTR44_002679 [Eurotiomycetes sp. CCFEE 6388]
MAEGIQNPLISSKPSDTGLTVSLHPLVLLTVSDQITRQSVRKQKTPVAGALLGQQRGREITAEHAFPVELIHTSEGKWQFNEEWMEMRIQQYKDVHKAPALECVGWFTLCPESGPLPEQVPLQKQAVTFSGDSAILLALHPESITAGETTGGKLPISVYESVLEGDHPKDEGSMQVDGQESSDIKFRHLPYTIDTDETEMIAIDYVAKGAGSAIAVDDSASQEPSTKPAETTPPDKKGKKRADLPPDSTSPETTNGVADTNYALSPEEQDQVANVTTRLNSVKMLQSRISLLRSFIQTLPPSYITDQESAAITPTNPDPSHLPHLRNIQALLTRLSLLTLVDSASSAQPLAAASRAQSNDVALASMLALLGQDIQALSELGRKFSTVESSRGAKSKHGAGQKSATGGAGNSFEGLGESDGRFGGVAMSNTGGMMV